MSATLDQVNSCWTAYDAACRQDYPHLISPYEWYYIQRGLLWGAIHTDPDFNPTPSDGSTAVPGEDGVPTKWLKDYRIYYGLKQAAEGHYA